MDSIDKQILDVLQRDSRLTNKEIGAIVHLTGQAVGNRVTKLLESGIIRKFSVEIEHPNQQFIRIIMDNNHFSEFERFVNSYSEVSSIYKISGQACYMIVAHFSDDRLKEFIEKMSKWGRHTVEVVIEDKTWS